MPPKGFKKRVDDQASYPDSAGGPSRKRPAPETGSDVGNGTKRKRVDEVSAPTGNQKVDPLKRGTPGITPELRDDNRRSLIDFATIPTPMLNAYLNKFDLVPPIYPNPLSPLNPPPPTYLINPPMYRRDLSPRELSMLGSIPTNRSRRDSAVSKDNDNSRRRSSRLLEDESGLRDMRSPILADVDDGRKALAIIAQRHFERQTVREVEIVTSFVYAVKTKDRTLKILPLP